MLSPFAHSKRLHTVIFVSVIVGIVISYWFLIAHALDSDFGWHLQMGRLIRAHGVPKTDPFSYTMPSFPYIDHEWLADVSIASIFDRFGYAPLAAFAATLGGLAIAIATISRNTLRSSISALALWTVMMPFIGVRIQLVTWVFFAMFVRVLTSDRLWKKYHLALPPILLLWVNLHAGFAIGLALIGLKGLLALVTPNKPHARHQYWGIFAVCAAISFLNPYYAHIWIEVWRTVGSSYLTHSIREWAPLYSSPTALDMLFLAIMLFFAVRLWRWSTWMQRLLFILLLVASFNSVRHLPLFALMCAMLYCAIEVPKSEPDATFFQYASVLLLASIALVGVYSNLGTFTNAARWTEASQYPTDAIHYLQTHPRAGNIFNEYDWGGYLILHYPEKKVFIDGRMPIWRRFAPVSGESSWVLHDFMDVMDGTLKLDSIAEKYTIDTVLIRANRTTAQQKPLVDQLEQEHWLKVYADDTAVVFRK